MKITIAKSVAALLVANISLSANENSLLDDITVSSAAGYEQKLADAPASISVVSKEDLQKKPYTNLLDAVKDIEGVDIGETRDKSGQGSISIRGMGSDYTLIMVDGKKQNNNGDIYPNNFGGFQSANLPPLEMIERIEIIRGPMSTLYGADAMGGVVNIITKKISNEWTGSFTHGKTFQSQSEFGNDTTSDISLMGPLVKDKLGLSLRGSYYDKEESKPVNDDSGFGGAGQTMDNQNWSFGTGLTFTPNDKHTIRVDYDISKQKYDNSEGQVGTIDSYETIFDTQRVGYAETQRMEREQYSISYQADWDLGKSTIGAHHIESNNFGRSLPLNASQRKFVADNTDGNGEDWQSVDEALANAEFAALLPRGPRTLKSQNTTYDAKFEMPLANHFVVVGAQYVQGEVEDGVFGMSENAVTEAGIVSDYNQWALFTEDTWMITDNFTFTTGLRYDNHDAFGSNVSPRAYAIYDLNDNWTFKGGVSTGYKTPATTDLYDGVTGFGGQGTRPWFGNPDLKPEKSLNKEIAAYYSHENGHNFNVTLFQNDFKDKIERTDISVDVPDEWTGFGVIAGQKQNIGDAVIKGIEIAGKYNITNNLALKANYTYTDSKRDDTGNPLGSNAEHLYSVIVAWQVNSKLDTFLKMSGEKGRWRDSDEGEAIKYYDDFQMFNLGGSYKLSKNVTFNGAINNLFDKDFTGTTYSSYEDDVIDDYNLAQKRREFWLSMNVTF